MSELQKARIWLRAALLADTDLAALVSGRVYDTEMPPDARYPCVLFELYEADETQNVNRDVIFARPQYTVKGIDAAANWERAEQIADRIQAVLHKSAGDGVNVIGCVRENPFSFAESDGTRRYRHAGGVYRVFVKPGV